MNELKDVFIFQDGDASNSKVLSKFCYFFVLTKILSSEVREVSFWNFGTIFGFSVTQWNLLFLFYYYVELLSPASDSVSCKSLWRDCENKKYCNNLLIWTTFFVLFVTHHLLPGWTQSLQFYSNPKTNKPDLLNSQQKNRYLSRLRVNLKKVLVISWPVDTYFLKPLNSSWLSVPNIDWESISISTCLDSLKVLFTSFHISKLPSPLLNSTHGNFTLSQLKVILLLGV
jgi:hypothetical protein